MRTYSAMICELRVPENTSRTVIEKATREILIRTDGATDGATGRTSMVTKPFAKSGYGASNDVLIVTVALSRGGDNTIETLEKTSTMSGQWANDATIFTMASDEAIAHDSGKGRGITTKTGCMTKGALGVAEVIARTDSAATI
mmetsp:Transcript_32906/g.52344  ORF Transcript_32906/g.52344 Transcript_32906/m.52344 type:complete len:143 (-) Transcript_32906:456-884(-)